MTKSPTRYSGRGCWGDRIFTAWLLGSLGLYAGLILALLVADASYTRWTDVLAALQSSEIRASTALTLLTSLISSLLAVFVAVPVGYVLARFRVPGKPVLDALLDIPIVLPPLVVGLSLLLLFNHVTWFGGATLESWVAWVCQHLPWLRDIPNPGVTYRVPAIIMAQFTVCTAFAVRTLRTAFDDLSPRSEQVAMTLGCSRFQAFWRVTLPGVQGPILAAGMLAWARAVGEFGPILVFAGATRGRTEVLSTSVFLEISFANIEAAVAVSLLMVAIAILVLVAVRVVGSYRLGARQR